MLTAIEGVYKDGHVHLNEQPQGIDSADVVVTFLQRERQPDRSTRMRFGQFPADGAFDEDDFKLAIVG
ncbi:MAG TPA: hypothetical protein VGK19_05045 [Capsulimonadaceae bacterium]|jgi:hypothetical protein